VAGVGSRDARLTEVNGSRCVEDATNSHGRVLRGMPRWCQSSWCLTLLISPAQTAQTSGLSCEKAQGQVLMGLVAAVLQDAEGGT